MARQKGHKTVAAVNVSTIRNAAAGAILAAVGPAIVGLAVTPPWEDVTPRRAWARGAVILATVAAVHWAAGQLAPPEDRNREHEHDPQRGGRCHLASLPPRRKPRCQSA